ncbi:uncharacterized protein UTRI_01939_B [Ustilago trichophora]|uniref:Uncharacterized protein n=1 Tax=Ustilago trichophora TaxID=86804 RepID=A0A5C3DU08_9BASI|nr:uncharacterized protein UTRI_01939_B [Ustilago trichophora]
MPSKLASASGSMSTPPPKKKKGGFFGCRSKHALDSLPRNARGENAAINRLQARNVFPPQQHAPQASHSSTSTAAVTPLSEEKGLLKLAELNSTASLPQTQSIPVKPLYAQEVVEGSDLTEFGTHSHHDHEDQEHEIEEEARDILPDEVVLCPPSRPTTPGAVRSLSVASKTGRIKRSLSLKRSGSSASAKLIARAPPVSSADFADLPASSSSGSDIAGTGDGDMASIRKARGRHQAGLGHQHVIPDISEDEYLALDNVPIPPSTIPTAATEESAGASTPKRRAMAVAMPDSDSIRAVAATLEGSTESVRFQPGPSVSTPKVEPPSPTKDAYIAEIRSQRGEGSEDTVSDLPRGFWDAPPEGEESGPGRNIPFQYVTNLTRPVSIASLRSLACPNTPPRTSSRPTSPNGTYGGLRSTKSFSVSPLKKQATFNGFPRTFFPAISTLKHSPSTASDQSRRKPVPEAIPALDFEDLHIQRQQRRTPNHSHAEDEEEQDENDVDRQLAGHAPSRSHTCSNCGVVEESRDFAAFVAKGKASRRTSVKQPIKASTPNAAAAGSLRKSKSMRNDTIGEGTLKRWGLAEAFQSAATAAEKEEEARVKVATVKKQKKMVPGPGGGYITDTANMRWCSALDEIKKALAVDMDDEDEDDDEEEESVQKETQTALAQADAVLARLGVET